MFADTWNGSKWTEAAAASPDAPGIPDITGLRCFSTKDCLAAGVSVTMAGYNLAFVATWNGKTWTKQKALVPGGVFVQVIGLSCVSAKSCAVVGTSTNFPGTSAFGFVEMWNGKVWKETKFQAPKGDTLAITLGVSCVSAANCVAVGAVGTAKTGAAAAPSWNGKHWAALKVPAPAKGDMSEFLDVSCPKAATAWPSARLASRARRRRARLAGYWNGKSWRLTAAQTTEIKKTHHSERACGSRYAELRAHSP